jgi:Ribbon-helix-helix protein, copG family
VVPYRRIMTASPTAVLAPELTDRCTGLVDRRKVVLVGGVLPAATPRVRVVQAISLYAVRVASEEQIQQWADEAEAGYDVDVLKRRGRGRPGRGAEPMQVVAVRLTAEELDALDAAAAKNDMSRSEAIRAALAHFAA